MKTRTTRILSALLTVVMLVSAVPLGGFVGLDLFGTKASAASEGIYTYSVSSGKATITDCDENASGAIMIPSTLGGYPVTSIGSFAFGGCSGLTSITIPDSVTSIGFGAFNDCSGLTSITIGNSVTSIGGSAFSGCTSLQSIIIPSNVTIIENYAFSNCENLTSITFENSTLTGIGLGTFSGCTRLKNIEIPYGITGIGSFLFQNCFSLESVTIPNSVTLISDGAFFNCTSLKSITIPDSVTSIGYNAFRICISLTSVTIPSSVTSIGGYAFESCDNLTDVYYTGTEEQWNGISIDSANNECLLSSTIHFNCTSSSCKHDDFYVVPSVEHEPCDENNHWTIWYYDHICNTCGVKFKLHVSDESNKVLEPHILDEFGECTECLINRAPVSARIIDGLDSNNTVVSGNYLTFEVKTSKLADRIRLIDYNYIVEEWSNSSSYVDIGADRIWTVKYLIKTVGENRTLYFTSGNESGYAKQRVSVSFSVKENPRKLDTITFINPLPNAQFAQNEAVPLVWSISGTIPDVYFIEISGKAGESVYRNNSINGDSCALKVPAECFKDTGAYKITITAIKEGYHTSEQNIVINIQCTHQNTITKGPYLLNGTLKKIDDSNHEYVQETQTICKDCKTVVSTYKESKTSAHYMHEGLHCECGHFRAQVGYYRQDHQYLQSSKTERVYLDASKDLKYWGEVYPSDSGNISKLGEVSKNGVRYAFIEYPVAGGKKHGFIEASLINRVRYHDSPTIFVNGEPITYTYVEMKEDNTPAYYAIFSKLLPAIDKERCYASKSVTSNTSTWTFDIYNGIEGKVEKFVATFVNSEPQFADLKLGNTVVGKVRYEGDGYVYLPVELLVSHLGYEKISDVEFCSKLPDIRKYEVVYKQNQLLDDMIVLDKSTSNHIADVYYDGNLVTDYESKNLKWVLKYSNGKVEAAANRNIYPGYTGTGVLSLVYDNGIRSSTLRTKNFHCFDGRVTDFFKILTTCKKDDVVYLTDKSGDMLYLSDIQIADKGTGYNVNFCAYNPNVQCFVIEVYDATGKRQNEVSSKGCSVSLAIAMGNLVEGGIVSGAMIGYEQFKHLSIGIYNYATGASNVKNALNNSTNFEKTEIKLWVPKGGYISIGDADEKPLAASIDMLSASDQFMDICFAALDAGKLNELEKALLRMDKAELCNALETGNREAIVNTFTSAFDIQSTNVLDKIISYFAPGAKYANMVSQIACNSGNCALLIKALKRNENYNPTNSIYGALCLGIENANAKMLAQSMKSTTVKDKLFNEKSVDKEFVNGHTIITHDGKFGIVDIYNNTVLEPVWDYVSNCGCGIIPAVDSNGCHFFDTTGKLLFETDHIFASRFMNNRCAVIAEGLNYGVIDNYGNTVVDCEWDYVVILYDGNILASKDNAYTLFNSMGNPIGTTDAELVAVSENKKYIILKNDNDLCGVMRYDGLQIVPFEYEIILSATDEAIVAKNSDVFVVYTADGTMAFEKRAVYIGEFSNSVATVFDGTSISLITLSGDVIDLVPSECISISDFKNNFAVVDLSNGTQSYMNSTYQLSSTAYLYAGYFTSKGFAVVQSLAGEWQLIDSSYEVVYTFSYEVICNENAFENGYVTYDTASGDVGYSSFESVLTQPDIIFIDRNSISLRKGERLSLNAVSNMSDDGFVWLTSDDSVVTVDSTGIVTAIGVGTATITVKTADEGLEASCLITVNPNEFTVTWVVDGEQTQTKVSEGAAITEPVAPVKDGYIFKGWSPNIPDIMPSNDLTFTAVFEEIVLTKIEINTMPAKTQYRYKESGIDLSGLTLKATYSDGSTRIISDTKVMNVTGFDTSSNGSKTITVEYGGQKTSFNVEVKMLWWQWIIKIVLFGWLWY